MKNEYKNLLNEMIPNAERFGSRMDLARHQAARMKKVIDAHNADVDAKTFPPDDRLRTGPAEFPSWHEKDVSARGRRIQSIAQAQGAKIDPRGAPPRERALTGGDISPNELKLAELDHDKKPMSTVNFSRLSDEDRQKGQVEADKLRTTGLVDRRKMAAINAAHNERQKITKAFTFESLTQMYANILRETYRITPKRREVLGNIEGRARQDAVDQLTRSPSVMTGSSSMGDQNDFLMNISKIARIEAIKQMGLPQDVRTGRGQGLNDRQLKTVMRNSRESQKNFEYLKRRGSINEFLNEVRAVTNAEIAANPVKNARNINRIQAVLDRIHNRTARSDGMPIGTRKDAYDSERAKHMLNALGVKAEVRTGGIGVKVASDRSPNEARTALHRETNVQMASNDGLRANAALKSEIMTANKAARPAGPVADTRQRQPKGMQSFLPRPMSEETLSEISNELRINYLKAVEKKVADGKNWFGGKPQGRFSRLDATPGDAEARRRKPGIARALRQIGRHAVQEGSRSSNRLIRKLGGERKANKNTTVTDTKLSAKLKDSSDRFINHPSHIFQQPEQDARANYAHSIGIHHVPGMSHHLELINRGEPREDSYLYSVDHIRSIRGAQSAGKLEKLRIKNDIRAGTRQPNEQRPAVYAGSTVFNSIAPAYRHSDFGPGGIEGENDSRSEVGLPELPARMSKKTGQPRLDATDSRLLSPDMGRALDVIEKMKKLEPERFARIQTDRLNRAKQYPDTHAEADKRMDDYLNSGLGGEEEDDEDFDGRAKEAMNNYKVAIMAHLRGSPEILSHEAEVPMRKGEEWKGETPMLPDIFRTRFRSRRPNNMQENITATNWSQQITEAYRMMLTNENI